MYKLFIIVVLCFVFTSMYATRYKVESGFVSFISDAPLEVIKAKSTQIKGVLNADKQTFGFVILLNSFEGFNSPLQQDHYNENYVESDKYPDVRFTGKIIEPIDFSQQGEYQIRAKGKMNLHGIEIEKIIVCTLRIMNNENLKVSASFDINLEDFNIVIPTIVHKKIAETIKVTLSITMKQE